MSNIDKIRQKIERLKGYISVTHFAEELLSFIDSLPDQPVEGLEEAARLYAIPHYMKDIDVNHIEEYPYDSGLEAAFIAGAEWQKQQKQTLDLPAGFYFIDKNGKKYYTDTLKCGNLKFIANQKEQKPEVEICPHSIKSKSYKEITGDETR